MVVPLVNSDGEFATDDEGGIDVDEVRNFSSLPEWVPTPDPVVETSNSSSGGGTPGTVLVAGAVAVGGLILALGGS
ncbi:MULTISPECIES: hypothetical protein [Salinibaculum]|uniref:hypothetical protein n=1 Tax=Salinibaculum TaxID=2732368 RepID=UPI0030CDD2D4